MSFSLQPHGQSANIAGLYTLTLTADSACTNLPDEARTRTYTATIVPGSRPTTFVGRLSDAQIVASLFSSVLRDPDRRRLRKYIDSIRGADGRDDLRGDRRRSRSVVRPGWNHGAVWRLFLTLSH